MCNDEKSPDLLVINFLSLGRNCNHQSRAWGEVLQRYLLNRKASLIGYWNWHFSSSPYRYWHPRVWRLCEQQRLVDAYYRISWRSTWIIHASRAATSPYGQDRSPCACMFVFHQTHWPHPETSRYRSHEAPVVSCQSDSRCCQGRYSFTSGSNSIQTEGSCLNSSLFLGRWPSNLDPRCHRSTGYQDLSTPHRGRWRSRCPARSKLDGE